MAISILSTQVQAPDRATPSQYQAALCMLTFAWPKIVHDAASRGVELDEDDHFILSLFLSLPPDRECKQGGQRVTNDGSFQSTARGIAQWVGWRRQRVNASISRLSEAGLLWGLMLEKGDRLGGGREARTNIIRYRVHVAVIRGAYEAMPRGYYTAKRVPLDGPNSGPSDGPNSGPSPRSPRIDRSTTPKPPSGDCDARRRQRSRAPSAHQAASETPSSSLDAFGESTPENSPAPKNAPREEEHAACRVLDTLAASWDALRIPEKGGTTSHVRRSERTLLAKRLAELGREPLEAAIVGASVTPWLTSGKFIYAACARVFGTAETVHEFAQRGRAELAERTRRDDLGPRRWQRPANDSGKGPC
jgi:hypothetical protein